MAAVAIATAMSEIGTAEATPRIEGPDGIEARGENSDRRFMVGVWLHLEGTKTEGVLLTIIAALALVALTVILQWHRGSRTGRGGRWPQNPWQTNQTPSRTMSETSRKAMRVERLWRPPQNLKNAP